MMMLTIISNDPMARVKLYQLSSIPLIQVECMRSTNALIREIIYAKPDAMG